MIHSALEKYERKVNGCRMIIYGTILPRATSIARSAFLTDKLTERAKHKIRVLDWHRIHGNNASLTARHFGMGRMTLYRWLKRFKHYGIIGLNEYSKRPKNIRRPIIPWNIVIRTVELRKQYPAWSKHKLKVLLQRESLKVSASTVGRILKRRGLISKKVSQKRRRVALQPKARFSRGLRVSEAGDMIQIDTKHIMLVGRKRFYQFTAIDVLGKKRVLRVYTSESSRNGADFLRECLTGFPFRIKAVQADNGSTFLKEFDKLCKELNLPHYFIYPRTPKQNTYVEISQQADKREFYQQGNVCSLLPIMQEKIKERENIWNNIRPHEALGQLTPSEYLLKLQIQIMPTRNVIILQI